MKRRQQIINANAAKSHDQWQRSLQWSWAPGLFIMPFPSAVSCPPVTQSTCYHLLAGAVRLQEPQVGSLVRLALSPQAPCPPPLPRGRVVWNEATVWGLIQWGLLQESETGNRALASVFLPKSPLFSFAAPFPDLPTSLSSHFPLSSLPASICPECSEQGLDSWDIPNGWAGTAGFPQQHWQLKYSLQLLLTSFKGTGEGKWETSLPTGPVVESADSWLLPLVPGSLPPALQSAAGPDESAWVTWEANSSWGLGHSLQQVGKPHWLVSYLWPFCQLLEPVYHVLTSPLGKTTNLPRVCGSHPGGSGFFWPGVCPTPDSWLCLSIPGPLDFGFLSSLFGILRWPLTRLTRWDAQFLHCLSRSYALTPVLPTPNIYTRFLAFAPGKPVWTTRVTGK